jgi:hypothetical protein
MSVTHLNDGSQLVLLVIASKERVSSEELTNNTRQTPHVDGTRIARTHNHLWCPVVARLNVRVDLLLFVAAGPKVDHLGQKYSIVIVYLCVLQMYSK